MIRESWDDLVEFAKQGKVNALLIMASIEIKEPEHLLVYEKGYSMDFVRSTIEKMGLNGLRIFDQLDPLPDLDFLEDYTFLTHLSITSAGDHDYSFLKRLTNLKALAISTSGDRAEKEIDLGAQTELMELVIQWRKHVSGFENCRSLQKLMLVEFKEKDLAAISLLAALKHLSIKTANIKDLNGIEGCTLLETVMLGNCKGLVSLSGLSHHQGLRKIELDVVTKAKDYDGLTDLPLLAELTIADCKEVPSLAFVRNLPSLKKLVLVGNTEISDGDLTPIGSLEQVFYTNRRHYNVPYPPANLWKR